MAFELKRPQNILNALIGRTTPIIIKQKKGYALDSQDVHQPSTSDKYLSYIILYLQVSGQIILIHQPK